ncbi:MAG: phosphonate ABC transporter ATP-binding protein [Candidatus Omnitrophica bacterium]|nr:phosphonate ABC transporter ATP-binding protein [Candidatus Omnitrophota bacterium]
MIKFNQLRKVFDDGTVALDGVTIKVEQGEFVVVLGPSGSGKTTLLRSVNGLVSPTSGNVRVNDVEVCEQSLRMVRRKVGMIFQQFNLVGNLSVINNVLTGSFSTYNKWYSNLYIFSKELRIRALAVLDRVGLLDKAYQRTDELSGGQQQRVGIARALMQQPDVLLADEPIASLDPMIAYNILSLLREISAEDKITVLCSLHQVDFAMHFAQRIVGLSEGKVVMDEPQKDLTAEYIRKIYKTHDKGLFFGPESKPYSDDQLVTWSEYK